MEVGLIPSLSIRISVVQAEELMTTILAFFVPLTEGLMLDVN